MLIYIDENDLFACFVQTDGHSISLQFAWKRQDKYSKDPVLALIDFNKAEVEKDFLPCAIDPGRKHIYTATIGLSSDELQVCRYSNLERRCYTGSKRIQSYVDKLKVIRDIKVMEQIFQLLIRQWNLKLTKLIWVIFFNISLPYYRLIVTNPSLSHSMIIKVANKQTQRRLTLYWMVVMIK